FRMGHPCRTAATAPRSARYLGVRKYVTHLICRSAATMHRIVHVQRPGSGASGSEGRPRRRAPAVMIWITRSEGAACDACRKTIPVDQSQYEVVTNGRETRLDRDCFRRRMEKLE